MLHGRGLRRPASPRGLQQLQGRRGGGRGRRRQGTQQRTMRRQGRHRSLRLLQRVLQTVQGNLVELQGRGSRRAQLGACKGRTRAAVAEPRAAAARAGASGVRLEDRPARILAVRGPQAVEGRRAGGDKARRTQPSRESPHLAPPLQRLQGLVSRCTSPCARAGAARGGLEHRRPCDARQVRGSPSRAACAAACELRACR